MTETTNGGKLFYDATCRFCNEGAGFLRPWLATRDIATVPFENGAAEAEMKLVRNDGRSYGGAEAAIYLARQFWFTLPLALIAMLPGVRQLVHVGYRWIARNRSCFNGACKIDFYEAKAPHSFVGWAVLIGLITLAAATDFLFEIPAWLWMWILAGALWVGFKFMNFRGDGGLKQVNPLYFAWIGTDAAAFRYDRADKAHVANRKFNAAVAFIAAGLVLIFVALPILTNPCAIGWVGVISMLCLFHFGSFALLANVWRRWGFPVEPIMQAPWSAKTLGELWGPRWNRAFSDWARFQVFRPLVRQFGVARGTLAGFLASGIAHELVISLPARGGFGLPTLYFLIQATGLLTQRKYRPLRNRTFTLTIALIPAPILFHPVFIERVFAPMMKLITLP